MCVCVCVCVCVRKHIKMYICKNVNILNSKIIGDTDFSSFCKLPQQRVQPFAR